MATLASFMTEFTRKQASYRSLADFLHDESKPALRRPDGKGDITHRALLEFVRGFRISIPNLGCLKKPIVAIILPNGPLLAATVMATSNWYAAAPINPAAGFEQVAADIKLAGASAIVSCQSESERLNLSGIGLDLFHVAQTEDGDIQTTRVGVDKSPSKKLPENWMPNHDQDIGIVLFTSGTSGTKKVVPMTTKSIVYGVGFVIESWALTNEDVCLNMMPLYHVGGLIRNIFAPIYAAGSSICCPAFDGNAFWDITEIMQPTWYYASPSMHSVILDRAQDRPEALAKSKIRLICNAAGGLLPALAAQLRDTFDCIVLPSYGMTECMPISTPPIDYKLDRPGTSGVTVGPELTILDGNDKIAKLGSVGRVSVRGEPLFQGYLRPDGTFDASCLTSDGWFDTGDMGYMDEDGYLYITGRNKEVINRGGELISPFEVENAIVAAAEQPGSPIQGRVSQALAFSLRHDVLQEVVGIVLVTPPGKRRVDARLLHEALKTSLQQVKWPVFIVYMDDVPKKNNKVLRIKLAERFGVPCVNDATPYADRHWEGVCPPADTDLTVPISAGPCNIDARSVQSWIRSSVPVEVDVFVQKNSELGTLEAFLAPTKRASVDEKIDVEATFGKEAAENIRQGLVGVVDGYLIPHKFQSLPDPFPYNEQGTVDSDLLNARLDLLREQENNALSASTSGKITKIFAELLILEAKDIAPHKDFMELGGDSLRAGKLLSMLRTEFKMHLPVDLVFNSGSVELLTTYIDQKLAKMATLDSQGSEAAKPLPGCDKTNSSTNPLLLFIQLIPMVILYPMTRGFQWTCFIFALSYSQYLATNNLILGRLFNVLAAMVLAKIVAKTVLPMVGIISKWVIIGRHKEGLYPMWGVYHTRWWLAQKFVQVCGKGCFRLTEGSERLYYRLLGAKIGSGVTLKNVELGEWDLIEIGDGATLDACTVRPMTGERNTSMYISRIKIGRNASIGLSSVVAPGSVIPDNTCIGPNSSSWEMAEDATEANRDLSATRTPKAHWLLSVFVTFPLWLAARGFYYLPWILGLLGLVYEDSLASGSSIAATLNWFAGGERIAFHYLARGLRTFFGPFFLFAFVVIVRKILDVLFGRMGPGSASSRGQIERWRMQLMRLLMPVPALHDLTELFGVHYEATSIAIRMLGGKAGKRIYWPGTGPTVGDYHLIDIGNDVVFGSRSHLVTSDGTGSETIRVGDGAMVADRVVALPGVMIEKGTVLGSGAMTSRGKTYEAGGTYVGSRGGDAICLSRGAAGSGTRRRRLQSVTFKDEQHGKLGGGFASESESSLDFDSKGSTLARNTPGRMTPGRMTVRSLFEPLSSSATIAPQSPVDDEKRGFASEELSLSQPVPHGALSQRLEKVPKSALASANQSTVTMMAFADEDDDGELGAASSPFGRAFYERKAPYYVLRQWAIFLYSTFIIVFVHLYWDAASVSAVQIANVLYQNLDIFARGGRYFRTIEEAFIIFGLISSFICVLATFEAILALAVVIMSKWILIGRRQPGNYDWDKSSYCQRWQVLLGIEKIRLRCFGGNGILSMVTGTAYCTWYFRLLGAKIGKDCALFSSGKPSLVFTEPDLLTLGDRVVVDNASLVGHINSRGKFDLNRLSVGDRCVLRTNSRLLSGAHMGNDSCLLEHTLIMGGDVVEEGTTMQGWPAGNFSGSRVN